MVVEPGSIKELVSSNEGAVFSHAEVQGHIDRGDWRPQAGQQFKVNWPLPYGAKWFESPERFLEIIRPDVDVEELKRP